VSPRLKRYCRGALRREDYGHGCQKGSCTPPLLERLGSRFNDQLIVGSIG
jgi:hypothetical protein